MRVLGIEGTAWAASAAVYDERRDAIIAETDAYVPEAGGIHPREAAEHMHDAIPGVIEAVLERAGSDLDDGGDLDALDDGSDGADGDGDGDGADRGAGIDAVAFSRGPGLGPCLRIVATAARALAQVLDVPLVGVNHMVAHLEIGRHRSGFASPVCLNASGANAHVLGYHEGRYRVLGETMDTGVGNAIDKFARHVGWSHPGGPKVETAATDGEYRDLPYVVKGMDFSFAGLTSAAKDAVDGGAPVEDVCRGLQETVFAMLTEVSERALSLVGADELVLGGGVGQNERLQEMLETMCAARGASFYAPPDRFLRDNAGMIALLGAKMYAAGDTLPIEESRVRPDYRPDEVPVTWRPDGAADREPPAEGGTIRGAEAVVELGPDTVVKRRVPKAYRHPALDERLRRERTAAEARLLHDARRLGVPTPVVRDVDPEASTIALERVGRTDLGNALDEGRVREVGRHLALLHDAGIVHGDPTTRNVRVDGRAALIDFGLGYHSRDVEDFAMDCHVFEGSLAGTAANPEALARAFESAYAEAGDGRVLERLREIEGRGRYRTDA